MSTYFSKLIKAGDKLREFNFRQTYLNDDSRYTVDVPDDKGNRIMFSIYKNAEAAWKVAAQLMPMWVHNAEQELATAIEENNEKELTKRGRSVSLGNGCMIYCRNNPGLQWKYLSSNGICSYLLV
ncbi:MAG TPA: hypothetical protein VNS32_00120, partial [Flavisolibacter sp.]|nr:hypothetical protein [Flavisolibacter sp.]